MTIAHVGRNTIAVCIALCCAASCTNAPSGTAAKPAQVAAGPVGVATPPATVPAITTGRGPMTPPGPAVFLPKPPLKPADWLVEHPPVTPDATPEAKALLHFLYAISTKHTMTGQHNFPAQQEYSTGQSTLSMGKTPALYGTDWGFAKEGDKDSAYVRKDTVKELIKQWQGGAVIALCWHAVPPVKDEPVTFKNDVQSKITDAQFNDLLTPGTEIYKKWCAQVDVIAGYLGQLQDAHVPVLWRPYHEINGAWFWWNGHRGDATHGTKQLYRNLYDRLVNVHKLHNLIWVWNPDQPTGAEKQFVDYFPGQQYVDVLALDCYGAFQQQFYDDLNALSDGKVMAISETSNPPALGIYKTQPKWTYFMRWAVDMPAAGGRGRGMGDLKALVGDPRFLSLQDPAYWEAINPVRKAAGLEPITAAPATRP